MRKNTGQSLFEVVISLGLIALVLFALTSLLARGQSNANVAKDTSQRARAVTEVNEWLRSERDSSWSDFKAKAEKTYCVNTLDWNTAHQCYSDMSGQSFSRQLVLSNPSGGGGHIIQAVVTMSWSDSTGSQTQIFTSYFSDWQGT